MNLNFMNLDTQTLERESISSKELATNFSEIAFDCYGLEGAEPKTKIIESEPLVRWLLNTSFAKLIKSSVEKKGTRGFHRNENGEFVIEAPRTVFTLPPQDTTGECCWQPLEFAKCASTVPVNILCLKDCEDILETLVHETMHVDDASAFDRFAKKGESFYEVNKRVARMSMAFYSAYNMVYGHTNASTKVLKPFHGLLQVMENPAVVKTPGCDILSGFDAVGCRLAMLGESSERVFATSPLTYQAIKRQITPDIMGRYPEGWTRDGDEIKYNGIGFLVWDRFMTDIEARTGEVWLLDGTVVGGYLATDLMPTEKFQRSSGLTQNGLGDCGSECTYYFNFGAVLNSNANKLAAIVDIPLGDVCMSAIGDLAGLINPETIIPEGPISSEEPVVVDPTLASLELNDGYDPLTPTFSPKVLVYTAKVRVGDLKVNAVASQSGANVVLYLDGEEIKNGAPVQVDAGPHTLIAQSEVGGSTSYTVTITAE